jgi:hypothetical protein
MAKKKEKRRRKMKAGPKEVTAAQSINREAR